MKTRINLTIDEELVSLSKEYASRHGRSVSELVETLLRELVTSDQPAFSEKWRGRFKSMEKDSLDSLFRQETKGDDGEQMS
jgi:hypothetical protein